MLYICCSPYQIFNSIHYMWHINQDMENDIIILGFFKGAETLSKSIQDSCIFKDVYFVPADRVKNPFIKNILTLYRMLNPKRAIKNSIPDFPLEQKKYTKIISSTYLTDLTIAFSEYYAKYNCKLDMIEDGTGPYIYGAHGYSKIHEMISKITGKGVPTLPYGKMWFYEPSLIQKNISLEIKKIPKIKFTENERQCLNNAFNEINLDIKSKYIFIFDGILGPAIEEQIFILNRIVDYVGKENIVAKLHPKTDSLLLKGYNTLPQNIPWELYCLNNDMNKKVVIVANTTVAFTPKFMFDQEPKIIFLNRYYGGNSEFMKGIRKMQEDLGKLYSNHERLMYPNSLEELDKVMRMLVGER